MGNVTESTTERFIRLYSQEIAERFQPDRIILFGSHARGDSHATSDVDLLVIMPVEGRTTDKAIRILLETRPMFAVALLVRTPQEVETRVAAGDFFLRDILKEAGCCMTPLTEE